MLANPSRRLLAALLCTLFGCAVAGPPATESLVIGTEGAYPPFNYVESDGTITGFDVDIGLALCKRIGADCSVVAQDWDGLVPGLLAGKFDLVAASMSITPERARRVAFTQPYYRTALTFVVPKDSDLTTFTAAALADRVVGVQSGTLAADYADDHFPDADLRLYPSQDDVDLDMDSGRLEVQLSDLLLMQDWVGRDEGGACCKLAGRPITDPDIVGEGIGIALRFEDAALRTRLDRALAGIRADGTYAAINDRYFDVDVYATP